MKKLIPIFFISLFMATIIAPTIIVLIDNTVDISFLIDASEEEEEKGKDKNKELEVFVIESMLYSEYAFSSETKNNLEYTYKKYPKPHLNLIFPPPEFI